MRIVLLFYIFGVYLNAYDVLQIANNLNIQNTKNYTYYIEDKNQTLSPKTILNATNLKKLKSMNQGFRVGPFWTRTEVKNSTTTAENLYFTNLLAGINKIDVYIYKNKQLIKVHTLGDLREIQQRDEEHRQSLFTLLLNPNEQITLVTRVENYGMYSLGWSIESPKHFLKYDYYITIIFALLSGFILFYIIYTLVLFKIYKSIVYLILALEVLFTTLYNLSLHGFIYRLDLGINLELSTAITWIAPYFASIFFTLVPYYIFNMKINYLRFGKVTLSIAILFLLLIAVPIYAQFVDTSLFQYYNYISFVFLLHALFLFTIAIYMMTQKELIAYYYLAAQGTVIISILIFSLALYGVVKYEWYYIFLIPLGSTIDSIILLMMQYKKNNLEYQENLREKELMLEQSRFFTIGQALGNITHQWKQPLAHIGSSITMLEAILEHDVKQLEKQFRDSLPQIKYDIKDMQVILDDFSSYYQTSLKKEYFFPKVSINKRVLNMLKSKIILKNTTITLEIDDNLQLHTYEHIFSNVLLILIDNSLDQFKSNNNIINIKIIKDDTNCIISYTDNAGGIQISPIDDIFKPLVSSKIGNKSSGLGLSIAKVLVNDKLNGTISVQNLNNGILFEIII